MAVVTVCLFSTLACDAEKNISIIRLCQVPKDVFSDKSKQHVQYLSIIKFLKLNQTNLSSWWIIDGAMAAAG